MAPLLVMLSDPEWPVAAWNLSNSHILGNVGYIIYGMFTHESESYVACNFNYLFKNEELLKVTDSHVHCKCGIILKTMPDEVVVITDH